MHNLFFLFSSASALRSSTFLRFSSPPLFLFLVSCHTRPFVHRPHLLFCYRFRHRPLVYFGFLSLSSSRCVAFSVMNSPLSCLLSNCQAPNVLSFPVSTLHTHLTVTPLCYQVPPVFVRPVLRKKESILCDHTWKSAGACIVKIKSEPACFDAGRVPRDIERKQNFSIEVVHWGR